MPESISALYEVWRDPHVQQNEYSSPLVGLYRVPEGASLPKDWVRVEGSPCSKRYWALPRYVPKHTPPSRALKQRIERMEALRALEQSNTIAALPAKVRQWAQAHYPFGSLPASAETIYSDYFATKKD